MREAEDTLEGEAEEVDALPVLAHAARIAPEGAPPSRGKEVRRVRRPASLPTAQAAAAAAGGLVAGAAVLSLVHRRNRAGSALAKGVRRGALGRRTQSAPAAAVETLQIVSSRTFLVDVHLLGSPGAES